MSPAAARQHDRPWPVGGRFRPGAGPCPGPARVPSGFHFRHRWQAGGHRRFHRGSIWRSRHPCQFPRQLREQRPGRGCSTGSVRGQYLQQRTMASPPLRRKALRFPYGFRNRGTVIVCARFPSAFVVNLLNCQCTACPRLACFSLGWLTLFVQAMNSNDLHACECQFGLIVRGLPDAANFEGATATLPARCAQWPQRDQGAARSAGCRENPSLSPWVRSSGQTLRTTPAG